MLSRNTWHSPLQTGAPGWWAQNDVEWTCILHLKCTWSTRRMPVFHVLKSRVFALFAFPYVVLRVWAQTGHEGWGGAVKGNAGMSVRGCDVVIPETCYSFTYDEDIFIFLQLWTLEEKVGVTLRWRHHAFEALNPESRRAVSNQHASSACSSVGKVKGRGAASLGSDWGSVWVSVCLPPSPKPKPSFLGVA